MNDPWQHKWRDYYEILQVHYRATDDIIDAARRQLAKKYHPQSPSGNLEYMQVINEAHGVLRNSAQRSRYDAAHRKRVSYGSTIDQSEKIELLNQLAGLRAKLAHTEAMRDETGAELEEVHKRLDRAQKRTEEVEHQLRQFQAQATTKPKQPPNAPVDAAPTPVMSLHGWWYRYQDRLLVWIHHQGVLVALDSRNGAGAIVLAGQGTFDGRWLKVLLQIPVVPITFLLPVQIQTTPAIFELSADGRSLSGSLFSLVR